MRLKRALVCLAIALASILIGCVTPRGGSRQATSAGLAIREIEGIPVIMTVDPGSEAARAGVEPGMIVRTIDGRPFANQLAAARDEVGVSSSERVTLLKIYARILAGPPGTPLELGLTRADGAPLDVMLMRRTTSSASPLTAHLLPSGHAYLRFDSFHSPVSKEIRRTLEGFRNAPALIIDLRNNGGGDVQEMLRIAGYFFNAKVFFGRGITRSGKLSLLGGLVRIPLEAYAGKPGGRIYRAPVVILVSERTGSAGESFAAGMQENDRATVIGRQSCGCVNGVIHRFRQKGGGELQFSELGYASPKGRKLEGAGVTPDQVVALTLADLRSGRDAGMEAAESFLRNPA